MALVNKIDSNSTGLYYCEEDSPKTVSGDEVWYPLEPNSYGDFGGQIAKIARNPINASRQRKKGVTTDLDASGGFNTDLTQSNLQDILQGLMFADGRDTLSEPVTAVDIDGANPDEYEVADSTGFVVGDIIFASGFAEAANNGAKVVTAVTGTTVEVATGTLVAEASPPAGAQIQLVGHQFVAGDLTVDVTGSLPKYVSAAFDLSTLPLIPGQFIYVGGDTAGESFSNAVNNGWKRVKYVEPTGVGGDYIIVDKSDSDMVIDNGAAKTISIFYPTRILKNETGTDIVRRTYQLERALGVPDTANPNDVQYEYLTGSVLNTATVNVAPANKITVDLGFLCMDHEQLAAGAGPKAGTHEAIVEADAFNTSTDFSRIRMAVVSDTDEAPVPLFAYLTDISLTVDNKCTLNKAVSVLGAFDITAGMFEVGGSLTAYFVDVESVAAVRDNDDVTLDIVIARANAGLAIDVPMIALGNGRLAVEQDQAIKIPLDMQAATGAKYDATMDHTLMFCFFAYLPTVAEA